MDVEVSRSGKHRFFNDGPKRNRTMELNRALSIMGFGTWNNLDPPDTDPKKPEKPKPDGSVQASVVEKLNKTMFVKLQEIEAKRERATALERKLSKMADGPKKRQIQYQKQQEEANAIKYKKTPVDEERALHEAYQILLRECEYRRLRNEKMANIAEGIKQRNSQSDAGGSEMETSKSSNSKSRNNSERRSPSPDPDYSD